MQIEPNNQQIVSLVKKQLLSGEAENINTFKSTEESLK